MPVLAHPPLPPPPPLHASNSPQTALPRRLDSDDLLNETLQDSAEALQDERDYTDDLEDIVSMSVAQQLHSRRSHSTMQTYLPSSPSLPLSPPPVGTRLAPSPSSSGSELDPSSPRSTVMTSSPSTGAKGGKRRPSAIPRPGGGGKTSRTPSPELGRRKGSLAPSDGSGQEDAGVGQGEEKWETLQVGPAASAGGTKRKAPSVSPARAPNGANGHTAPPSPAARAKTTSKSTTSSPMNRAKTVDFPSSSSAQSSLGASTGRPRPSGGSAAPKPSPSSASTPRKRAATQASLMNGSSPASTPSPSARAARPSASRTQTSTTSRAGTAGAPPVRRKSLSTAQELAPLRARAGVDPVTGLSSSASSSSPTSPRGANGEPRTWANDPAPLVYRTSKGDLAFASASLTSGEGDPRRLRPEDRVLPAVARRLEAERLAALERDGKGDGVLVSERAPDGTPRSAVSWSSNEARRRNGNGTGTPSTAEEAVVGQTVQEQLGPPVDAVQQTPTSTRPDVLEPPQMEQYPTRSSSHASAAAPDNLAAGSAGDTSAFEPYAAPPTTLHHAQQQRQSQQISLASPPTPAEEVQAEKAATAGGKEGKKPSGRDERDAGAGCCRCTIC
ncbi:hypothetical protein JCM8097_007171 [Rhodosporidiobolus ruineniae]